MRHASAVHIVDERVQVAVMELCVGPVGNCLQGRLKALLLEHRLHALDHRHGFIPGAVFVRRCGKGINSSSATAAIAAKGRTIEALPWKDERGPSTMTNYH